MEKDRIIDTKELQIYRNTFIYDDSVVQLRIFRESVFRRLRKEVFRRGQYCVL